MTQPALDERAPTQPWSSRRRDSPIARRPIEAEIGRVIVGQHELVRQVLICLIANAHALLEGVPGLGKTMLVRTIADVIDCTFNRIQFTPDLMPADITGTNILIEEGGQRVFRFQPGPIFANLVLADEINRATPKTQSALLEAMQEHQVSVARERHKLDAPFFVLATQNPLEMEGHLPAPRGAARPLPVQALGAVPVRGGPRGDHGPHHRRRRPPSLARPPTRSQIVAMQQLARSVPIAPHVTAYAVSVLAATHPDNARAPELVRSVRALRRLAARRPGAGAGRQDPRPDGRPLQRGHRRHPRGGHAGAAPPGDPQLRGRGRGDLERRHRACRARRGRAAERRLGAVRSSAPTSAELKHDRTPNGVSVPPAAPICSRPPSTRPSSTRRSCASSSGSSWSRARPCAAASRASGGASSAASRWSSPTTATTPSGDDLRSLDWNVYARLEKLFIKLFVEEEDVTVHILLDASASMDGGTPDKLVFGKRAAAALAYIGLASYDRVTMAVLQGRVARRFPAVRGTGRVFQVLSDLSGRQAGHRPDRPRRRVPALRRAADPARPADADQRPLRPAGRAGDQRACRHALRRCGHPHAQPGGARSAARGRPPPGRSGDGRGRRHHRRPDHAGRLPRPPRGLAGALEAVSTKRRVSYLPTPTTLPLADLVFAELRRRRVVA